MGKRTSSEYDVAGWLGFDSRSGRLLAGEVTKTGDVAPAGFVAITTRPQLPFRGMRLFVHQPIASSFVIHSFRVGVRETTVTPTPIPADAFATRMDALAEIDAMFARDKVIEIKIGKKAVELLGAPWTLPMASVGTDVTIYVENIDDRPLRFLAAMLGETEMS